VYVSFELQNAALRVRNKFEEVCSTRAKPGYFCFTFSSCIPNIQLNIWNGDTVQLPSRYLIATVEELDSQLWTVNSIKPNTDNTVSLTVAEYSDAIYQ